jgi:hypothetical protein
LPTDIVALLTAVTKGQSAKMAEKDAEIAALRASLVQQGSMNRNQEVAIKEQERRLLQMELALAEISR